MLPIQRIVLDGTGFARLQQINEKTMHEDFFLNGSGERMRVIYMECSRIYKNTHTHRHTQLCLKRSFVLSLNVIVL